MKIALIMLGVLTVLAIAWATILRPWLRKKPWAQGFFAKIETAEILLYEKSEGIFWARWQQFLGIVLMLCGLFGGLDYTWLVVFTPEWVHPVLPLIPSILNVTGTIAERLRRDTTKPLEQVALPTVVPATVAIAEARVEVAKAELKETIKEAKAEGAL